MSVTTDDVVDRDRLTAARAERSRQAAERAALDAARRIGHLSDRSLAALAELVEQEQQRRAGTR